MLQKMHLVKKSSRRKFFLRTLAKALTARLPEFLWTLVGIFLIFNGIEKLFGIPLSVEVEKTDLLGAVVSTLLSDFIPGFVVYVLNELAWERKTWVNPAVHLSNMLE